MSKATLIQNVKESLSVYGSIRLNRIRHILKHIEENMFL